MHKKIMRVLAVFLSAVIFLLSPFDSLASAVVPIASSSDASVNFEKSEYMLENIMTRYEESFTYCPNTIEEVLSPTSRIAISSTILYILTLILAACGIYVSSDDIVEEIFTSFETWLRMNYGDNSSLMFTWRDMQVATLGVTIVGMKTFIPIFKQYLSSSITGYGTPEPVYSLPAYNADLSSLNEFQLNVMGRHPTFAHGFKYFVFHTDGGANQYNYKYYLVLSNVPLKFSSSVGFDKVGSARSAYTTIDGSNATYYYANDIYSVMNGTAQKKQSPTFDLNDSFEFGGLASNLFGTTPVYDYDKTTLVYSPGLAFTPSKTWHSLQTDLYVGFEYNDGFVVPDTESIMQAVLNQLSNAESVRDASKALAPSLTITDSGTGDSGGESGDASILGLLNSMLTAMLAMPLKIGLEVAKALNIDSVVSGLDDVLSRISQWDFADWKAALGTALLLALDKAFVTIGLDGVAATLLRIAQWDFSDWITALGATLLLSLSKGFSAIGLDKVSDALLSIAQWDFADWKNALSATLLLSLMEFARLVGIDDLSSILSNINDWVSSIPATLVEIKDFLLSLPGLLALEFSELLKALFIPVNNPYSKLKDLVNEKFPIIGQLKNLLESLVFGSKDGIPRFEFTYMGVTVNIFELQWLMTFLPWIHSLIIALAWYRYLSRLYKRMPAIIGGFQI